MHVDQVAFPAVAVADGGHILAVVAGQRAVGTHAPVESLVEDRDLLVFDDVLDEGDRLAASVAFGQRHVVEPVGIGFAPQEPYVELVDAFGQVERDVHPLPACGRRTFVGDGCPVHEVLAEKYF